MAVHELNPRPSFKNIDQDPKKSLNSISVTTAFGKLKEMQNRVLMTKKRVQAMLIKEQKTSSQLKEMQRIFMNKSLIQNYNQKRKKQKQELSLSKKDHEQKQKTIVNFRRQNHQQKISEIKEEKRKNRQDIYLSFKKESKNWEKTIERNKKRVEREKQRRRNQVVQKQLQARMKIQEYNEEKIRKMREEKLADVEQMKKRIQEKDVVMKELEHIVSLSNISEIMRNNPEEIIDRISTLNSEKTAIKINRMKNGRKIFKDPFQSRQIITYYEQEEEQKNKEEESDHSHQHHSQEKKQPKVVMHGRHGKTIIY